MILEFVGPPGSGKSSIATALAAICGGEVCSVSSRKARVWYAIRYAFASPFRFLALICLTMRENARNPPLLRYKLSRLLTAIALAARARREGRRQSVFVDEGLAQYALVSVDHALDSKAIRDYFSRYVDCDALVIVLARGDVRHARMMRRGRVPRSELGVDQRQWQAIIERNARLIASVPNLGQCITVSSEGDDIEAVTRMVAGRLRELGLA